MWQTETVEAVENSLASAQYVSERGLSVAIFLALKLKRPLFLEGEPGVGKTEVARVLASLLNTELIRLQCYEGLDLASAVYEWDYPRQMLEIRLLEASGEGQRKRVRNEIYSRDFLLSRPLLKALEAEGPVPPVLLIDELDRADEEFEAFLLEILSDWQVSIPELGVIRAETPPVVILTSNRTREVHDALKRRCLYYWIDYPSFEKEYKVVRAKVPGAPERLSRELVLFVQRLRTLELYKPPGVAETLDWAAALLALDRSELSDWAVGETLGVLLKYQEDVAKLRQALDDGLLKEALEVQA